MANPWCFEFALGFSWILNGLDQNLSTTGWVHCRFDKHRLRFFWEANGPKRKYHWVLWSYELASHVTGEGLWFDIINNKYLKKSLTGGLTPPWFSVLERYSETKIGILRGSET
jgi:hypothetical protein